MPDSPLSRSHPIVFHAIGFVRNHFTQSADHEHMRAGTSEIVIDAALTDGLIGLEPGQQIMVIFYFHLAPEGYALCQHPRGDPNRRPRGVFALRSPHRPNAIGVTIADLLSVQSNVLQVQGLDALNDTPVLDIKPLYGM